MNWNRKDLLFYGYTENEVMQKPFRYTAINRKTGEIREQNFPPMLHHFQEWEAIDDKASQLVCNWDFYENMRYKAALRLYNYLTYTKQGKEIPRYRPFAGAEIGKTIPILNF